MEKDFIPIRELEDSKPNRQTVRTVEGKLVDFKPFLKFVGGSGPLRKGDAFEVSSRQQIIKKIYRLLAKHITTKSLRRYLEEAEIPQALVDWDGNQNDICYSAVKVAHNNGQLSMLIDAVKLDYEIGSSPIYKSLTQFQREYQEAN